MSARPLPSCYAHVDERGARPVVEGTDIKVSQIASEFEHLGMTADEIVEAHPHLTLAAVHAALAYYYDHQSAIRAEWQEAHDLIEVVRQQFPGPLRKRPA